MHQKIMASLAQPDSHGESGYARTSAHLVCNPLSGIHNHFAAQLRTEMSIIIQMAPD